MFCRKRKTYQRMKNADSGIDLGVRNVYSLRSAFIRSIPRHEAMERIL